MAIDRIALLKACELYLETRPEHRHGFCYWARIYCKVLNAYYLVSHIQEEQLDGRTWVDDYGGPTPARVQFVQDLRDYLLLDI